MVSKDHLLSWQVSPALAVPDQRLFSDIDKLFNGKHDPKDFLGWIRLPEESISLKQVKSWLKQVKKSQTTCCVFGIGGSCLGAKAVYDFVEPKKEVLFFDNVDGHSFEARLSRLNLKKCHFLVISKSGETSETLFQLAHLLQSLKKKKLKPSDHISVITEEKMSSLRTIAVDFKIATLSVPPDVGGRYSVFSCVGLAPLAWAGVSIDKLLQGAMWAKEQRELIVGLSSFYLAGFDRSEWISVFWSYVDGLKTFGLWLEQLWAESLGKAKTRRGGPAPRTSTPLSCTGATDQHSLLQQFTEGARDKHFLFIRCVDSERSATLKKAPHKALGLTEGKSLGYLLGVEADATQKILADLRVATARLTLSKNDIETFGALLFLFEMVVALIGERLDINAFDQPGVEAVKKVTLGTLGDTRYLDHALRLQTPR